MSIYLELIERVSEGESFHINFEKRNMKVGNDYLIKECEFDESKELISGHYDIRTILNMIEELYELYKYSLPSERSDSKRRKYFKALSVDELTDEQLIVGQPREIAQFAIEAFILCTILSGDFVWDEEIMGKWFYQHPSDPDLIILKSWIEGK